MDNIQIEDIKKEFLKCKFNRKYLHKFEFNFYFYLELMKFCGKTKDYLNEDHLLEKYVKSAEEIIYNVFEHIVNIEISDKHRIEYADKIERLKRKDTYYRLERINLSNLMWNCR